MVINFFLGLKFKQDEHTWNEKVFVEALQPLTFHFQQNFNL
jgi:hypothetical protein